MDRNSLGMAIFYHHENLQYNWKLGPQSTK